MAKKRGKASPLKTLYLSDNQNKEYSIHHTRRAWHVDKEPSPGRNYSKVIKRKKPFVFTFIINFVYSFFLLFVGPFIFTKLKRILIFTALHWLKSLFTLMILIYDLNLRIKILEKIFFKIFFNPSQKRFLIRSFSICLKYCSSIVPSSGNINIILLVTRWREFLLCDAPETRRERQRGLLLFTYIIINLLRTTHRDHIIRHSSSSWRDKTRNS